MDQPFRLMVLPPARIATETSTVTETDYCVLIYTGTDTGTSTSTRIGVGMDIEGRSSAGGRPSKPPIGLAAGWPCVHSYEGGTPCQRVCPTTHSAPVLQLAS